MRVLLCQDFYAMEGAEGNEMIFCLPVVLQGEGYVPLWLMITCTIKLQLPWIMDDFSFP